MEPKKALALWAEVLLSFRVVCIGKPRIHSWTENKNALLHPLLIWSFRLRLDRFSWAVAMSRHVKESSAKLYENIVSLTLGLSPTYGDDGTWIHKDLKHWHFRARGGCRHCSFPTPLLIRWGDWGWNSLNDLYKVPQLINGSARVQVGPLPSLYCSLPSLQFIRLPCNTHAEVLPLPGMLCSETALHHTPSSTWDPLPDNRKTANWC